MEYYWETFINIVDGTKLIIILVLILIDFVLGIAVALKNGTFQLAKIANFLNTSVLYFLGGYFLLGLAATVEPAIQEGWVIAAWAALDATMVGFIIAKVKELGVPIPDQVGFLKFPSQQTPYRMATQAGRDESKKPPENLDIPPKNRKPSPW